jgi:mono/diheme cytochrome c family protein
MNPVYALAYNNRGYVYESQGRRDDAMADFRAALLLDPSLIGARDGLRRLGIPDAEFAETQHRVEQGRKLVEQNCRACHAIGPTGTSPNKKAPEFRTLHARHPNLALREPLSRGIAAPHDEMPRFTLSGPEIDTIVAYINSLSSAAKRVSVADAAEAGDRRRGLAYARRHCASCHNVQGTDAPSPNRQATPFRVVANTSGMTVTALTVWSRTTHPTMPNLVIEQPDMDDLIAYILSLREAKP